MVGKLDMAALWKLSYGLYIVSSTAGERRNGQIANSVMQVTAEPPQIAVALNKKTLTHSLVEKSGLLSVSILDEEAPMTLIGLFGFKSGREIDKMSQCHHSNGAGGCPIVLDHTTAVFEGVVRSKLDVGTHTIFVAEITAGEVLSDKKPMTYDFYHTVLKGKASENAPTYRGANTKTLSKGRKMKYECDICGWIYDPELGDPDGGIEPGTDFEDIPEDWVCPVCGAGKDDFSPVE